jgi:hypothetical protein
MTNEQFRILYGLLLVILLYIQGKENQSFKAYQGVRISYQAWEEANPE